MIDGQTFFDQTIKNDQRTCDYTTGCLLDYPYFEKHYMLIAIDLRK